MKYQLANCKCGNEPVVRIVSYTNRHVIMIWCNKLRCQGEENVQRVCVDPVHSFKNNIYHAFKQWNEGRVKELDPNKIAKHFLVNELSICDY